MTTEPSPKLKPAPLKRTETLYPASGFYAWQGLRAGAIIEGRTALPESRSKTQHKVNLIVDIQSRMREGKGPAYERWAKIFNLKQMAAALQYLQENGLMEYEQFMQKAAEVTDRFYALSDRIKTTEAANASIQS